MNKQDPRVVLRRLDDSEDRITALNAGVFTLLRKDCLANTITTLTRAGLQSRAICALRASRPTALSLERALLSLAALGHQVRLSVDGEVLLDTNALATPLPTSLQETDDGIATA